MPFHTFVLNNRLLRSKWDDINGLARSSFDPLARPRAAESPPHAVSRIPCTYHYPRTLITIDTRSQWIGAADKEDRAGVGDATEPVGIRGDGWMELDCLLPRRVICTERLRGGGGSCLAGMAIAESNEVVGGSLPPDSFLQGLDLTSSSL